MSKDLKKDLETGDMATGPEAGSATAREKTGSAKTAARRPAARRRTVKQDESPEQALLSLDGSESSGKATSIEKTRVAPVPRNVPCEWTPELIEEPDEVKAKENPAPAAAPKRAARATLRAGGGSVKKTVAEAEEIEKKPPEEEDAPKPVRRAPPLASAREKDQTDESDPSGEENDEAKDEGASESSESVGDRGRRNAAGDGQQRGGQSQNQQRGERRFSRHEIRRMSRRERMLLRANDELADLQPEEPNPDAPPPLRMSVLQAIEVPALLTQAEALGIADDLATLNKHEVVFELLKHHAGRGGQVIGEGVLEILKNGTGYLRNPYNNYHTCPEDAFVLPAVIRKFGLRAGQQVVGATRPPRGAKDRHFLLVDVDTVNGLSPADARRITPFESLTPLFPNRRIHLETEATEIAMRVTDIFTPIGFGQRGLIVAPPRTGKTVLMQKMANAISANHPEAHLIILLIDERPEEVTDMQRNTKAHVLASTFDEPPEMHVQVADTVIEMSRRMVEQGKDVIILLDSITRLARAYNTLQPSSGKILSGGVDANALQKPKRFFGAARNIENGGSLTIIATALVDTGSRMDEVIFEEFKGTGNMELGLDRSLVDKRVFPAINIERSGTRKEELLLHPEELGRTWMLRRALTGVPPVEAVEMIIGRLKKTATNAEFLMSMKE